MNSGAHRPPPCDARAGVAGLSRVEQRQRLAGERERDRRLAGEQSPAMGAPLSSSFFLLPFSLTLSQPSTFSSGAKRPPPCGLSLSLSPSLSLSLSLPLSLNPQPPTRTQARSVDKDFLPAAHAPELFASPALSSVDGSMMSSPPRWSEDAGVSCVYGGGLKSVGFSGFRGHRVSGDLRGIGARGQGSRGDARSEALNSPGVARLSRGRVAAGEERGLRKGKNQMTLT